MILPGYGQREDDSAASAEALTRWQERKDPAGGGVTTPGFRLPIVAVWQWLEMQLLIDLPVETSVISEADSVPRVQISL